MAQFTFFSSMTNGKMYGDHSGLISKLDACLPTVGWTKPFGDDADYGCYLSGSPKNGGNGFGLIINDNAPNVTASFKEAWANGYESLISLSAGTNPFPTAGSHVTIRKSAIADSLTPRDWILYADDRTFFLGILTGDLANTYSCFYFGDIFSLNGSDDYGCVIIGRNADNVGTMRNAISGPVFGRLDVPGTMTPGHYACRNYGGGAGAIAFTKTSDLNTASYDFASQHVWGLNGNLQSPNGPDDAYYLCPIGIMESGANVRGRLRGLYMVCHADPAFTDAQAFSGAGELAGKTFRIVKAVENSANFVAYIAIEISDTLETNV